MYPRLDNLGSIRISTVDFFLSRFSFVTSLGQMLLVLCNTAAYTTHKIEVFTKKGQELKREYICGGYN